MSTIRQSSLVHLRQAFSLNCGGRLLDVSSGTIMGILNVTPDSFYDGGKFIEENSILLKAGKLVAGGAQIIDIGGASSRPGAAIIPLEVERERVIPAIKWVASRYPDVFISVDTWRAAIAEEAINNGAHIINDISGGDLDPDMFKTVAKAGVPYILMHMKGIPETMQEHTNYSDLLPEMLLFFQTRIHKLRKAGVKDIIIDPGFGFGKSLEDNYKILAHIHIFKSLDCPVLAGFSRKSMINKILGVKPEAALNGTTVLNTIALLQGIHILRVHDAQEANECLKIIEACRHQLPC